MSSKKQRVVPAKDFFQRLPGDLHFPVFDFLDPASLGQVFGVCKSFADLPRKWTQGNWTKARGRMFDVPRFSFNRGDLTAACESFHRSGMNCDCGGKLSHLSGRHLFFSKFTARLIFRQICFNFLYCEYHLLKWFYRMVIRNQDPELADVFKIIPSDKIRQQHRCQLVSRMALVALGSSEPTFDPEEAPPIGESAAWYDPDTTPAFLRRLFDIQPMSICARHFFSLFDSLPDHATRLASILISAYERSIQAGKHPVSAFQFSGAFYDDLLPCPRKLPIDLAGNIAAIVMDNGEETSVWWRFYLWLPQNLAERLQPDAFQLFYDLFWHPTTNAMLKTAWHRARDDGMCPFIDNREFLEWAKRFAKDTGLRLF